MSPIRHLTPVVLGLAVSLSAGIRSVTADDAVIQQFGGWKVTIQPGVRAASTAIIPPTPAAAATIRLIAQKESTPVDQELAPPAPAQPENVEIIPNHAPPVGSAPDPLALVHIYPQVYNSIPFSRAEYEANPSYRHDATMEFLFGQLRPTVIQRGTTTVNHRYPNAYLPAPAYSPYGFNSNYYPFYTGYYRPYSLW